MRDLVEEIKRNSLQNDLKTEKKITKFEKDPELFKKYFNSVVYVGDKICMIVLREMFDMKMLAELPSQLIWNAPTSVVEYLVYNWFKTKKKRELIEAIPTQQTKKSQIFKGSGDSVALNQFIRIFNPEESQGHSQNYDNRSQFSDFSLRFNQLSRTSEDFFGF